jgi:drug/metabolite transporter (DMT)-like permease
MAALLALCGAGAWGIGDFFGGLASRRISVLAVLAISEAVGLAGVVAWVVVKGDRFPGISELLPAAGAGLVAMIGLGALYRGFAIGAMGIVAPISAASPLVPLSVDAAHGTTPSGLQLLGIALVLVGIIALSYDPQSASGSRVAAGAGLAVVAAIGFGLFVVGIDAGADESPAWAVAAARAAALPFVVAAALVTSTRLRAPRALLPVLVAVGIFDTGANVLVAAATTQGAAGIVAVLSALYPLTTILLARVILGERLSASKRLAGGVALAGAALVASG